MIATCQTCGTTRETSAESNGSAAYLRGWLIGIWLPHEMGLADLGQPIPVEEIERVANEVIRLAMSESRRRL